MSVSGEEMADVIIVSGSEINQNDENDFFLCGGDDGDGNDDFLVIFFLCAIEYHGIKPINHDGYSSEKKTP